MPSHPPRELPEEPSLRPEDRARADVVEAHGALFDGTPLGTDVAQSVIGDCFFLAALASLTQRRPDDVRAAIHARDDGTYAVRFFRREPVPVGGAPPHPPAQPATGAFVPDVVIVGARLPEAHGRPLHAAIGNGRGLWVALFEKAFAVRRGGYGALDRGGTPNAAIEALTGRTSHTTWLDRANPDGVWAKLTTAIAEGRITLASTWTDEEARDVLSQRRDRGEAPPPSYNPATFSYGRRGLVEGHQYSIWALHGAGDRRVIELRNPWAYREPQGNGSDDGIFSVPLDDFVILFANITVGD